jgi:hypothetical protein
MTSTSGIAASNARFAAGAKAPTVGGDDQT